MRKLLPILLLTLAPLTLKAQRNKEDKAAGYDKAARAVVLHVANVYTAPDTNASRVSLVTPGHEVVIVERSGPWVRVFANTDSADKKDDHDIPDFSDDENATPASGWIRDKGILNNATPNGDAILFGAAASFEDEAARPHAPKGAASAAHLLYQRVPDYFPASPLAAQALFRAGDVRWQIDKRDISDLPSAKEQEAYLRPQLYEGDLRKVIKLYPGTPEAASAAFDLIDNKLCGDWQGLPKCPELESNLYEKYANQYPTGPKTPEALYDAIYRQGVLVTMYQTEDNRKRSDQAAANTQKLTADLRQRFPQSDYSARATSIAYRVQQSITIFGNDRD